MNLKDLPKLVWKFGWAVFTDQRVAPQADATMIDCRMGTDTSFEVLEGVAKAAVADARAALRAGAEAGTSSSECEKLARLKRDLSTARAKAAEAEAAGKTALGAAREMLTRSEEPEPEEKKFREAQENLALANNRAKCLEELVRESGGPAWDAVTGGAGEKHREMFPTVEEGLRVLRAEAEEFFSSWVPRWVAANATRKAIMSPDIVTEIAAEVLGGKPDMVPPPVPGPRLSTKPRSRSPEYNAREVDELLAKHYSPMDAGR